MTLLSRVLRENTDGRAVSVVRVVVGSAVAFEGLMVWDVMTALLQDGMFAMPLVDIPRLPLPALPVLLGLWLASAAVFAAGWYVSVSGPLLAACLSYVLVLDEQTYSNHLYLMILVIALVT